MIFVQRESNKKKIGCIKSCLASESGSTYLLLVALHYGFVRYPNHSLPHTNKHQHHCLAESVQPVKNRMDERREKKKDSSNISDQEKRTATTTTTIITTSRENTQFGYISLHTVLWYMHVLATVSEMKLLQRFSSTFPIFLPHFRIAIDFTLFVAFFTLTSIVNPLLLIPSRRFLASLSTTHCIYPSPRISHLLTFFFLQIFK